ncbi:hypothetical protein GA0115238_119215 [Streptomyces sp. di50b]|nr:hypothetical protein GA0115238_119215 [Streptomyces sp. di50b]
MLASIGRCSSTSTPTDAPGTSVACPPLTLKTFKLLMSHPAPL